MKILIADTLAPSALDRLERGGYFLTIAPDISADELPAKIADHEVLIVRSTKVTAATINVATRLSLIVRAGAGVNTIDLESASNHGIHVANCPGKNKDAVAELAIGLMIAADRRIVNATTDLRQGKWNKKEYGRAYGLTSRTLGVLGMGAIGRTVARYGKGLGMKVIGWSPNFTPEEAENLGIGYAPHFLDLAEKADAISVHIAYNAHTHHFINEAFLSKMKDEAILINTSRGAIHDTEALKEAIRTKKLKVGLDVFENEPGAGLADFEDQELAAIITATPHIGASTSQASEAIALEAVRIVNIYRETGTPVNAVNLRDKSTAEVNLVVRHYNRVGVLANVLDKLKNDGINVEEMENTIFSGGKAAVCTLKLDHPPKELTLKKIMDNIHVIQVALK